MIIIKHAQMSSFIGSKFCDTTLEIFQGCHGNGIPVPVAILPLRMSGNSLIIPGGSIICILSNPLDFVSLFLF